MDIVHYVDNLDGKPLLTGKRNPAIEEWLRKVNGYVNQLLLPRFAKSAFDEFSTLRRVGILSAKEASSGSFDNHLAHSAGLIKRSAMIYVCWINSSYSLTPLTANYRKLIFICFRFCVI